ncbi:MAG: hypothetical protein ACOC93_00790, partial [Planctomycetota bacterium]
MAEVIKADQATRRDDVQAALLNLRDVAAEAQQMVLDARKEAMRIKAEARQEVDAAREQAIASAREQARAEGYRAGWEQGMRDARSQADRELGEQPAELTELARHSVASLQQAREQLLTQSRRELLN